MNGRYLLDTNVIIALLSGEAEITRRLSTDDEIFLPSIAMGELYYGARKSGKPKENLVCIDELVLTNIILVCDSETARRYGEIKNTLRIKGRPLPENDIWIAALAHQHNLTLVTRDTHFEQIDDLNTTTW